MIPDIAELNNGGCSSCGGSCNGSAGEGCCNHVPDGNGLVVIDFDVFPANTAISFKVTSAEAEDDE